MTAADDQTLDSVSRLKRRLVARADAELRCYESKPAGELTAGDHKDLRGLYGELCDFEELEERVLLGAGLSPPE